MRAIWLVVWVGCGLGGCVGAEPAAGPDAPRSGPSAAFVGPAVCRSCHPVESDHWSSTVHARAFEVPRTELEARVCEACHGPGSRHVADPAAPEGILRFSYGASASVREQNRACLVCHDGGARIHWRGSRHEVHEVACSDCHNPMARFSSRALQARASINRTCFTCHPQQRSDFWKRSHMPLHEGKMACSDCHEPHGSVTDPLLKGDSVNQLCTTCHAEKRGPFLWEHPPASESCLNCHRPHGSNHAALLVAPLPFLCQRCHSQLLSFSHPNDLLTQGNLAGAPAADERLVNRACVNCHVQIHGSNHPSGARFHR